MKYMSVSSSLAQKENDEECIQNLHTIQHKLS